MDVTERHDVFLSYSRNDMGPATLLLGQLEKAGLRVFRDQESIRQGDLWLSKLQAALEACGSFVVLVGRDGVRRWIGAETEVALIRHSVRTMMVSACRSSRSCSARRTRLPPGIGPDGTNKKGGPRPTFRKRSATSVGAASPCTR